MANDTHEPDGFSLSDEELVIDETPYGDYYVTRAKRDRSAQIKAAMAALEVR